MKYFEDIEYKVYLNKESMKIFEIRLIKMLFKKYIRRKDSKYIIKLLFPVFGSLNPDETNFFVSFLLKSHPIFIISFDEKISENS